MIGFGSEMEESFREGFREVLGNPPLDRVLLARVRPSTPETVTALVPEEWRLKLGLEARCLGR